MKEYIKKYKYGFIIFKNEEISNHFFPKNIDVYQEHINEAFKKYYIPNTDIIDVGGNYGIFTISFSNNVSIGNKVYSFEPIPETVNLLNKTINYNKCKNVILNNYGLGNKNEKLFINYDTINPANSSIIDNITNSKKINIEIKKLDVLNLKNISFIKVDVQSYELEVILGARKTLIENNITLILELPFRNYNEIIIHKKCEVFLKSIGYIYKLQLTQKDFLFRKTPL